MQELDDRDIEQINGGATSSAIAVWTILIACKDELKEIGEELGAGFYDGLHS
ncbi:hypothetical protein [Alteromonas sediminis]|uniref:hypothetical protein n=1 Tax=Alteromonas sediminis TaxID=2259342 RepID=UPI0014042C5D|nr:hypothetical protein [Alteromonas sediminis]